MKLNQIFIWILLVFNTVVVVALFMDTTRNEQADIPNLIGTWSGENVTVSDLKGYKVWGDKVVHITEQKDRRFRGTFTYLDGKKDFFGVIYPDNKSFTWVVSTSRGYNHGRILGKNRIAACYVESWDQATAGCATLDRQKAPDNN
jgi:hypothetical protein